MSMDYVRSSTMAGNNIYRLLKATLRGSVRRSNADGTSAVPYFPSLATKTLTIVIDGFTYNVTFSASDIVTAISDINAQIYARGIAFDSDGTISIRTLTDGGLGSVEITGGNSAPILGFDLNLGRRVISVGGDIPSSPEGRVGNPFGTVFPGKGDEFKASVFQGPLAAIASNVDVLHADLAKQDAELQVVPGTPYTSSVSGIGSFIYLGVNKVYNGYDAVGNKLTKFSTAQDLAGYFVLLDATTRRMLPNYVVEVVVGSGGSSTVPASLLDAGNQTTDTGKNALGVNLLKWSGTTIDGITDGRVIKCTGIGTAAAIGDIVNITGATNVYPWSNNGKRWVVDTIGIGANYVGVRPASKSELAMLNSDNGQLQTSLNGQGGGGYGSASLYSGPFVSNVSLIIQPALSSTNVEVWAVQPISNREKRQTVTKWSQLFTPYAFMNPVSGATYPHLASKKYDNADTADLLQLQNEAGSSLLRVASTGFIYTSGALYMSAAGMAYMYGATGISLTGTTGGVTLNALAGPISLYGSGGGATLSASTAAQVTGGVNANLTATTGTATIKANAGVATLQGNTAANVIADTGGVSITATDASSVTFKTTNISRWAITSGGRLAAQIATPYIDGNAGLFLTRNATNIFLSSDSTGQIILDGTGTVPISLKNSGSTAWKLDTTGSLVNVGTGHLDLNYQKIAFVADGTLATDAATLNNISTKLANVGSKISGVSEPTVGGDAVTLTYLSAYSTTAQVKAFSDLTNYYTQSQVNDLTSLTNFYNKTTIDNTFNSYSTTLQVKAFSDLANYTTTSAMTSAISNGVTTANTHSDQSICGCLRFYKETVSGTGSLTQIAPYGFNSGTANNCWGIPVPYGAKIRVIRVTAFGNYSGNLTLTLEDLNGGGSILWSKTYTSAGSFLTVDDYVPSLAVSVSSTGYIFARMIDSISEPSKFLTFIDVAVFYSVA